MLNKTFSQLSNAERTRKLITVIRRQTKNLLDVGQINAFVQSLDINRQYIIAVYHVKNGSCKVFTEDNVLCIYIPEQKNNTRKGMKT